MSRVQKSYNPETIIILTPHGLRLKGYNAIYTCEYSRGTLSDNGQTVSAEFSCDQDMARDILKRAEESGIPQGGAGA
jgi:aromatic ring-opening dioxygenase LigB subunit